MASAIDLGRLGAWSIIAVTNKHTAKLHHVCSLYILTYDARKLKHEILCIFTCYNGSD